MTFENDQLIVRLRAIAASAENTGSDGDEWLAAVTSQAADAIEQLTKPEPLFIPLKREYFEAFENGTKQTEYRLYGPKWNEQTCAIGRPVVLSLGYGKARRLRGEIVGFVRDDNPHKLPGWKECYGLIESRPAACIGIAL